MDLEILSSLCTVGVLSDSDGHGPRSQLNYNWQHMLVQTRRTVFGPDSCNIPDKLLFLISPQEPVFLS